MGEVNPSQAWSSLRSSFKDPSFFSASVSKEGFEDEGWQKRAIHKNRDELLVMELDALQLDSIIDFVFSNVNIRKDLK